MGLLLSLQGAIGQGILWGIMAVGVYITFRLLDFADLTVDGSFATGGAVCAIALTNNINPILAILIATLAGFAAGLITGILHTKCKIPAILAGILTQIGLYSINLRIMGKSNIPLLQADNIFKDIAEMFNISSSLVIIIVGSICVSIIIAILYWFFGTEMGSSIRATGNNEQMVRSLGVNTDTMKLIGLMISNGLIAFSGAIVAQQQGASDVKMGIGAIVIALASIVIGEVVFGKKGGFAIRLVSIIIGSIVYRMIVAIVLQMGLSTDDLKLLTALLVAIALTIPVVLNKKRQVAMYKKLTGKEMNENA
ncbi:MAG: ABC transporter permease [Coprobacillus sp.]